MAYFDDKDYFEVTIGNGNNRRLAASRLQELLGHPSVQLTLDAYGHLLPDLS